MADGARAIVTGAASGIGRATALRLADDGWAVCVVDRDAEGAARTVTLITEAGGVSDAHTLDLTEPDDIARGFAEILEHGAPTALVNNAGIGWAATLTETDDHVWDTTIAVNLTAQFHTCRAVLPAMIEAGGGLIVNVSSAAGLVGVRRRTAYCASKAGILGLTRSIAVDHAAEGIRCNAICPGTVASEWIDKILADADDPVATRAQMAARQLDGRMGTPEEVAAAIAFLLDADARFVNGSAFVVDGGLTAV